MPKKKPTPDTTESKPEDYTATAIVFLTLGLGMMIPEGTRVVGIPFLVLGLTFLALRQKKPEDKSNK